MDESLSRWMADLDAWLDEHLRERPTSDADAVELRRRMLPKNANSHGTVFGGDLLYTMDEAGSMAAERYAGRDAVTASISQMSFEQPVDPDDLLRVDSTVEAVGETSMTVSVDLYAQDTSWREPQRAATAYITYVATDDHGRSRQVPELEEPGERAEEAVAARDAALEGRYTDDLPEPEDWDVENPVQMRGAGSTADGRVLGGEILRQMDEVASIAAREYCGEDAVTASLDSMSFEEPVYEDEIAEFRANVDHVGETSMTIGVDVRAYDPAEDDYRRTGSAYLTFVALDETGSPRPVPSRSSDAVSERRSERARRYRDASRS